MPITAKPRESCLAYPWVLQRSCNERSVIRSCVLFRVVVVVRLLTTTRFHFCSRSCQWAIFIRVSHFLIEWCFIFYEWRKFQFKLGSTIMHGPCNHIKRTSHARETQHWTLASPDKHNNMMSCTSGKKLTFAKGCVCWGGKKSFDLTVLSTRLDPYKASATKAEPWQTTTTMETIGLNLMDSK
jgi:hypothetical protein